MLRPFPERIETLVLSGGGMRGVASLGAVSALRRAGALRHVTRVVGTSAGALVATAFALDKASVRLLHELSALRYRPDVDLGRLLASFGLDSGRHLDRWIHALLGGASYTFQAVRERRGIDLVVCATDLTNRRAEYFGPDTTPGMDVATALRMSCAVPLCFAAVKHGQSLYVDGAVSDNFPLDWASRQYGGSTAAGIAFQPTPSDPSQSMEGYINALVESSTRQPVAGGDRRVLCLDTGAKSAFDFGMPHRDLKRLYASGARQAAAWYKKGV